MMSSAITGILLGQKRPDVLEVELLERKELEATQGDHDCGFVVGTRRTHIDRVLCMAGAVWGRQGCIFTCFITA